VGRIDGFHGFIEAADDRPARDEGLRPERPASPSPPAAKNPGRPAEDAGVSGLHPQSSRRDPDA
jgi:hypothetical protein